MRDESRPAFGPLRLNGTHPHGVDGAHAANGHGSNDLTPSAPLAPPPVVPANIVVKCPNCKELLVGKDLEKSFRVCGKCGHHFRLSAPKRIELLLDPDTFEPLTGDVPSADPLRFVSRSQPYPAKLESERANTGLDEAVVAGRGRLEGMPVVLVVMDFRFIGGSMGTVAGERITQAIEMAADERWPLIICSASGGARMQEGLLALMQMGKTSIAMARMAQAGVPFISLLTDPTTGGVAASFAFQGDVILAEPRALIGFAGPRVIEQTIHERLPKDVDTSEFWLEHGMIDGVVHRRDLKATLGRLLRLYSRAVPVLPPGERVTT
jgi:acetyl-CoA carboxylase carboxyl transferase subunit beta